MFAIYRPTHQRKSGHELLIFLDVYSGYNQIHVEKEDEVKKMFITNRGTYCYRIMQFGLKNVGATYKRMVTKMFKDQLSKIMEVYIGDLLVKSAKQRIVSTT